MQTRTALPTLAKAITCALMCALVIGLFWPGLSGSFFFDDALNILEQKALQIHEFSIDSILDIMAGGPAGPLGRPVSLLTFAANYYFSGFNPFVFKLTNTLIHCLNTILLALLVRRLIIAAQPKIPEQKTWWIALAIATLWGIHPIQLTSVLYVVQRMTSLASLFMLAALNLHVWARQRGRFDRKSILAMGLAWGVCFPLGVLSKESALIFPLYVAAYEAILHRRLIGKLDSPGSWYLKLLSAGCLISLIYLFSPAHNLVQAYDSRPFTFTQRVLTEPRVIWEYIRLLAAPWLPGFSLYHDDIPISNDLFTPITTAFSIIGLIVLTVACWLSRHRWPIVSFAIFWFLAGHSLESTILPLELMHEHRNYLPSLGIFLLFASPALSPAQQAQPQKLVLCAGLLAFGVYAAMLTYLRAEMYGNEFHRTQIEAQYHPDSPRTNYTAGATIVNRSNMDKSSITNDLAKRHFEKATSLDPTFKYGLIGILQIDCLSERTTPAEAYGELERRLNESKWERSDRSIMHTISELTNAKTLCLERPQVDTLFAAAMSNKTIPNYDRSIVLSDYAAYLWLGQEDYATTLAVLREATTADPNNVLNKLNLLQLLRQLGDQDGAVKVYGDLVRMKLNRLDQRFLQRVEKELVSEGVIQDKNL